MKAIGRNSTSVLPRKYMLLWFSPIIVIACIVKFPDWRRAWLLNLQAAETVATIEYCTTGGLRSEFDDMNVLFTYTVDKIQYKGMESCPVNQKHVFNPYGLPVLPGHKYIVEYYPGDPEIHRLLTENPLSDNMNDYLAAVADTLGAIPEFSDLTSQQRLCVSIILFDYFHYDGWATILFHNEYLLENFSHNGYTFRKLIRSGDFKKVLKECGVK